MKSHEFKTYKINENERRVLVVLYRYSDTEECCLYIRSIARSLKISYKTARRIVRALKRKGLAEYHTGLIDDDGMLAGSGYSASPIGLSVSEAISCACGKAGDERVNDVAYCKKCRELQEKLSKKQNV